MKNAKVHSSFLLFMLLFSSLLCFPSALPAQRDHQLTIKGAAASASPYHQYFDLALQQMEEGAFKAAGKLFKEGHRLAKKNEAPRQEVDFKTCYREKLNLYQAYFQNYQKGQECVKKGDFRGALPHFTAAMRALDQAALYMVSSQTIRKFEARQAALLKQQIATLQQTRTEAIDEAVARGIDTLLSDDPEAAVEIFSYVLDQERFTHQSSGTGDLLRRARAVEQYFDLYQESDKKFREKDYKGAKALLEKAESVLNSVQFVRQDQFLEYDRKKRSHLAARYREIDDARIAHYRQAISQGEQLLRNGDHEQALQQFGQARQSMYEKTGETSHTQIDKLQTEARYQLMLSRGRQQLNAGDYLASLESLQQGMEIKNTPELTALIQQVRNQGYAYFKQQGDAAFLQGSYQASLQAYEQAAAFIDRPELLDIRRGNAQKLRHQGALAFRQEQFEAAKKYYSASLLFEENRSIRDRLSEIEAEMQFQVFYREGEYRLLEEDLSGARHAFRQALDIRSLPTLTDHLQRIEDYLHYRTEGKAALGKRQYEEARRYFLRAQKLFSTREIRRLLERSGSRRPETGIRK